MKTYNVSVQLLQVVSLIPFKDATVREAFFALGPHTIWRWQLDEDQMRNKTVRELYPMLSSPCEL